MRKFIVAISDRNGAAFSVAARFACATLALLLVVLPARADIDIAEVTSGNGLTAWLVEDESDPMIAISFAFKGGTNQDPEGKEGLADLMVSLLDEGAGDLDSDAFQQQLYATGAQLSIRAGDDMIFGSLRMLAGQSEEALKLLSLALERPRFDEAPFERIRSIMHSRLTAESNDPDARGAKAFARAIYGDHPRGRPATMETLSAVKRDDLAALHQKVFARSNLIVGVVGAIGPEELRKVLDEVFGDLPADADLKEVLPPQVAYGKEVLENYDRPQTSLSLVYPGVGAVDPEIYAATLVTEILGGSGLESRFFQVLREERGLTYGGYANLLSRPDWGTISMEVSTRSDRAGETLQLTQELVREMAEKGPTAEELEAAKQYAIGAFPINELSSTSAIASTLVNLQRLDRGRDYLDRRVQLFEAVTPEAARETAQRLFSTEPSVLIVGPAEGQADRNP